MMKFITRGFADGTDFIGTDDFYPKTKKAGRGGFGDMICEFSNLYAQTNKADVAMFDHGKNRGTLHPAYRDFMSLVDMKGRDYNWECEKSVKTWEKITGNKCKTNDHLCEASERNLLMPYPDYPYVRLRKNRFEVVKNLPNRYITYQSKALSGKCQYDRPHVDKEYKRIRDSYGVECFDIHGKHNKYTTAQIAYIIDNAVSHVGIDSGMTHFALCIKKKENVHIVVPKDKITGVSYRWINQGYKVELV